MAAERAALTVTTSPEMSAAAASVRVMTGPQYQPLTQEQAWALLVSIGAGSEALASFRANPAEMTRLINNVRTSPLDMKTKLALIAASDEEGGG